MDDLISRKAAINEVSRFIGYIDEDMIERIQIGLKRLPTAQPNLQPTCNQLATDCIDRRAAIDAIRAFYDEYIVYDNGKSIEDLISELPSAQTERKKGKWLYHESIDVFECSVCGHQMVRNIFNYCPWCGADMRGEDE